jgi:hypothetical protein
VAAAMRIRQVRPEFFSDPITSRLSPAIQLVYIGLWCIADDAGWLRWDVSHIAALLGPYVSVPVRERRVTAAGEALIAAGRLVLHECGCAVIPTLVVHQRIGGNKSFTVRDLHKSIHSRTRPPVSNGSNGTLVAGARAQGGAQPDEDDEKREQIESFRRLGLPVDI